MRYTRSELRRNVLDAFNEAEVEIMTPIVNAVRNSAELAIPARHVAAPGVPALRFLGLDNGR